MNDPRLPGIPEQQDEMETYIQSADSETDNLIPQAQSVKIQRALSTPQSIRSEIVPPHLYRSQSTGDVSLSSDHPFISRRRTSLIAPPLRRRRTVLDLFKAKRIASRTIVEAVDIYDVDTAIDTMGMGRFQWVLFFIMGLISAAYAMEVMLIAFLLPILQKEFGSTPLESTMIPLSSIIGAFIGAFLLSFLADKFGRKKLIIFGVVCTAIFGVVSAFAVDIIQESIARFFVGFFMKIGVVAITLFAEFLPTKNRGKVLILLQAFWTLGLISSVFLGWYSMTFLTWRAYVKLSTIPLWIAAIGVCWKMPESPHYLITDGQDEQCLKILTQISEKNHVSLPSGTLSHSDHKYEHHGKRGNVCGLFCGENASPLNSLLLLFVYIIYQSSYYGIIFVSVRYFAKLDSIYQLHHEMYWEMLLTTFSEIPGIAVAYYLIDNGRAKTMNVSLLAFSVFTYLLVFIDFEFNRVLGIVLLFLSRMCISVTGMAAGVYFLEYYDTHVRATALGFAVSISMIIKFAAIVVAESLHIMIAMYIFGTIGIFAFVASLILEIDHPDSWFLLD